MIRGVIFWILGNFIQLLDGEMILSNKKKIRIKKPDEDGVKLFQVFLLCLPLVNVYLHPVLEVYS